MKKLTILILFVLSLLVNLSAQDIESWMKTKEPVLFEKLYVHVDRELYATGDLIWMKAYQVNGFSHHLNSNFRNIFIQLVTEDGRVVRDMMLFSINGQAHGEFKTDSLADGTYIIRAFTKYLKNFGEEACFHQKVWISKPMKSIDLPEKAQADDSKIDVAFLPEGGNLIINAVNTVAFKAIDAKGKGIYVSGKIRNDQGDTITSFNTSYLGMGKFNLMPEAAVSYYATIDQYPELNIPLPQANKNGLCLKSDETDESMMFEISANMKGNNFPVFYFIASHKGEVLIQQKIGMVDYTQSVKVSKSLFPKGISKISLLDTALIPVAERLIFVDDGKGDLLSLRLNQQEFKPREAVKIDVDALLEPGDSITSTMSVAVVNKNYLGTGENNQNIKSYLLLDSDLKGAIETPASYFVDDKFHTSAEKLDLLMLVHGWRTYIWDDVVKIPTPSLEDWNDAGINISGRVKKLLWNIPTPEAEVSMDYIFRNFRIGKTTTDSNGRFLFKHTYLVDTLKVMINARTKKGSRNAEITLDPLPKKESVVSPEQLKKTCFDISLNPDFNRNNAFRQKKELEFNPEKGTILLEGVDVVEKKTRSFSRSWGAYAWAEQTLTPTRDDYRFGNVVRYLVNTVPGSKDDGDFVMIKGRTPAFMVDGVDCDPIEFSTVHMDDIETIDLAYGIKNGGIVLYVAIYRKPINRPIPIDEVYVKGRILPKLEGFHRPAIYYSPKYTLENINSPRPDFRPTLYWNPDVNFVNCKASLDFFTSDVPDDYVVYLEGITKNGKICFGTTNFTVNKNQ